MKNTNSIFACALIMALCSILHSPAQAQRMPQDSWYLAKEMKRFVEPGKFDRPHDASLGPDGNLYVADRYNHRVQVFTQDGIFVRQFGNYGSGNGEFNEVTGIHVAPDGKVYLSDLNNRVQVFNNQGIFIRSMGQQGSGEGQLSGPHGVTVDNDGNVYVVDHHNARVSVFKPDGTYLRQWGSSGSDDGQFLGAIAICRTPDNKIAVLERDGRRAQVFETNGTFIRKFATEWTPHGIETDSSGNFYVTARDNAGFSVFNSDGIRTAVLAQNGGGAVDGMVYPTGLAVGNGKVFACDWDNHRIVIFSTDGTWIKNFGTYQSSDQDTHGIAVDADGNIFISYHQANVIYKFSPDLAFIKSFGSAGSGNGQFNGVLEMAIGPNNRLYVVDHSGHRVQYFDIEGNFLGKFGSNGTGNGNFNYPWGIAVSKDNKVYVADRDNHRIQVFDANGNFVSKFGTRGSFDGQFQSPKGVAVLSDGRIMVNDSGNRRLQAFDAQGNVLKVSTRGWSPDRICASSDGQMYGAWGGLALYDTFAMGPLKEWGTPANGPIAESKSGDLICAHHDRVVRIWKRTFRTVHPDPANAIPLPTILSQSRRPGTSLVDVEYTVKDADDATVQTGALAFKNGGNSLNDVIPIKSLAEGTGSKLGSNIATGQTHRFTWNVAGDWNTDFAEVQLEILTKDNRDLLNLDFIQIPASGGNPELKISRSPLNDSDFLSVWYWLLASGDPDVKLENGQLLSLNGSNTQFEGLVGEYYSGNGFQGEVTPRIGETPMYYNGDYYDGMPRSIRWTGNFVPQESGNHTIRFYNNDDGRPNLRFFVNGNELTRDETIVWYDEWWQEDFDQHASRFSFEAEAGTPVQIKIEYDYFNAGWVNFSTSIQKPNAGVFSNVSLTDFTSTSNILALGSVTTRVGRDFIFQRMGLREATTEEVTRAKEAGTPGVINQWEPKFKVGPDERPAKVNAYGFDTGASGYWVVPVTIN